MPLSSCWARLSKGVKPNPILAGQSPVGNVNHKSNKNCVPVHITMHDFAHKFAARLGCDRRRAYSIAIVHSLEFFMLLLNSKRSIPACARLSRRQWNNIRLGTRAPRHTKRHTLTRNVFQQPPPLLPPNATCATEQKNRPPVCLLSVSQ